MRAEQLGQLFYNIGHRGRAVNGYVSERLTNNKEFAMNCRECGIEVDPESIFCQKCGARLDATQEAAAKPPPEPENHERLSPLRRDDPEQELWSGGYSPRAMIGAWIAAGVATVIGIIAAGFYGYWTYIIGGLIILWAALGIRLAYKRLSISYRLTSHRFFHEKGLLRRQTDRIEVIDMDDITFTQGIVERMLGIGTIKVTSSDLTDPELYISGIEDVKRVAGLIDDARRAERVRRGLHIEAV